LYSNQSEVIYETISERFKAGVPVPELVARGD
jgi:hypothetical protein